MIQVRTIDHVVLRTSRLERMLEFYRDLLNCPLERELPELGLVQLRAGSALIDLVPVDSELGRQGGGPPRQEGRNMDHLCLQIEAVDQQQLLDYLVAGGIEVEAFQPRYGAQGTGPSLYIRDPEGNTVELKLAR